MKKVTLDDLIGHNQFACTQHGEESLLTNKANLLSALGVQESYYTTDEEIACALFRSIIIGHGFLDGNKRTAYLCLQDILPPPVPMDTIVDVAVRCATGQLRTVDDIAAELYPSASRKPKGT